MSEASATEFEQYRPFLTGLAYRMLGSFADAQDIVQDAFLRWYHTSPMDIANRRSWLATVVTRLCLDWLGSARVRREAYVGPWLPDPVVETLPATLTPEERIDAPVALMLALERLSPLERAAFVLHDLLDMELPDLADALQRSPPACRQLLVRARSHVGEVKARYPVAPEEGQRVAAAFFEAIRTGNVEPLRDLLAQSAILHNDGGGKVVATLNPIVGGDRIFRFFRGITGKHPEGPRTWSGPLLVSGLPGYVSIDPAGILQTTSFAIEDGRIVAIYIVRNPDKLSGLAGFATLPVGKAA
ncbi:RNA polymerase sigma factor SigJ [Kaistia algarum]|uniref:sigma-70 family RNA polymerase sigma factor n=1 Tax=Kaistia algarum TaxID=2083279 RepID=UPI000CE75997|nr:sigma-70 family RNA polymerase sigma factor [Kaistia algarum]MCX5513090.1 sigma-70 family RNA polymerase sigma factor [Kaistia algarum]PPE81435.1 RNA polymerase sigma factor SigJ [Kaistia algarum]